MLVIAVAIASDRSQLQIIAAGGERGERRLDELAVFRTNDVTDRRTVRARLNDRHDDDGDRERCQAGAPHGSTIAQLPADCSSRVTCDTVRHTTVALTARHPLASVVAMMLFVIDRRG